MDKPPPNEIVLPTNSPESGKRIKSNLTECIACKRKLEAGSFLCSRCGSFQVAWKNHLRYWSTMAGLLVFMTTALAYLTSIAPEVRRVITWKDRVQVLDVVFPGFIVLNNIGDGDVIVRQLHWTGTVQDMEYAMGSTYTIPINKKLSIEQRVETIELKRGEFAKKEFLGRYMRNEEVPKERRLKLWQAAGSFTDECWDLKIQLEKSESMRETEMAAKKEFWSVPLEGTIYFYSVHAKQTFQEKFPLLGFVVKSTDSKC